MPDGVLDLIFDALSVDPKARPSLDEFERQLWNELERADYATFEQMDHIEGLSSADPEWHHVDQRLHYAISTVLSERPPA
jgi:hypothetical protein